jgi:drug/metabolite transporter (DMT)-like permease
MLWILIAITAHIANAAVFAIDKGILGAKSLVSEPARYAALSGLTGAIAGVVLVFSFALPTGFVVIMSLVAGCLWVLALWLFFTALKQGEASRMVPITGSSVPLFTLLIASIFLGEQLVARQLAGVVVLIGAGIILAIDIFKFKVDRAVIAASLGGAAFAAHFAVVDVVYANYEHFLAGFAYTRIGVGLAAMGLLLILYLTPNRHAPSKEKKGKAGAKKTKLILSAFVGSKLIGAGALLAQNWAISLGSVSVVNALQGVQYVFLLLIAIAVSIWKPQIFAEELSRVGLLQKVIGVVLVVIGLGLIV